jgi:hypothetical protein
MVKTKSKGNMTTHPEEEDYDARYPTVLGRRGGRNSDRKRKRKNHSYDEAEGVELVATQFTGKCESGSCSADNREGNYRK